MSLKKDLGKRLLQDMIRTAKGTDPAIVLVVDPHTSKILSSALRMYDLMETGVLVLQNLLLHREKLPDLPAIYFVDPTVECIEQMIADFPAGCVSGPAAAKAKPTERAQYLNAHVYFTSHVPQAGMNLLKGAPSLMKKLRSFVELNVDFLAFESRVFLFDQPSSIPRLYFPTDHTKLSLVLSAISKPLVSLCVTLQEFPHVRYSGQGRSGICKGLATFFDLDMKKTVSQLSDWKMNEQRERGTLLILDRSMDPIAPLMHEFTFQAMVNDILSVHGEIATLPVTTKNSSGLPKTASEIEADRAASELVLSEDDPLWMEFRHKHIGEVMVDVTRKFKEFKGVNKMAVLQQEEKAGVKDMIQAMKDMPVYKEMMKKYHKHMSLAQECMSKFDTRKFTLIGDLEQDMATGLNVEGKSINLKEIKDRLVQLCQDPRVDVLDKLRLVMIYTISQGGIQDATRRELMKSVDPDLQQAIRNLDALGVDLSNKKPAKMSKERLEELKDRNLNNKMALMRYVPQIHSVIDHLVTGNLREEAFPYTGVPPLASSTASTASGATGTSARRGQSARKKANSGADWKNGDSGGAGASSSVASAIAMDDAVDLRPRFIVFVLGGVTFSEMRSAYEIAEARGVNLYLGSTDTLTPTQYLQDLSGLAPTDFKRAVDNSTPAQSYVYSTGAASSVPSSSNVAMTAAAAPSSSSRAAASAAAPVRGPRFVDSDSDDDEPVNLRKLDIKV